MRHATTGMSADQIAAELTEWAETEAVHVQAAVELIVRHGSWLEEPGFREAAIVAGCDGSGLVILWNDAWDYLENLPISVCLDRMSDVAVLRCAIALAENVLQSDAADGPAATLIADAFARVLKAPAL